MPPATSLGLIFDLDGTLVDTAPDLLGATNAVLDAEGRAAIDPASLRHMVGFGARSLITQAMAATGAPVEDAEMERLVGIFIAHYRDHIADFSQPFPGVEDTLKALKAGGARLGVLTNKPFELTGPLLAKLDLSDYFTAVYGAGSRAYTKPDPRIFHDVVADLFAEGGGSAVMIGDSVTDLYTARAAGVPCILMSYGYTPVPAAQLGGDLVLDDFAQLPEALKRLGL
jgi:phosphoglycolate phosphatase